MPLTTQQSERKLGEAFGEELPATPLFTPAEQKELLSLRDDLRSYLPRGIRAEIAREVNCTRQYVGQVLDGEDTFDRHRSDNARQIWLVMKRRVLEKKEPIDLYKFIVGTLRKGEEITIQMNSTMNRFLARRLKELQIGHTVKNDHSTMPITYSYKPKK